MIRLLGRMGLTGCATFTFFDTIGYPAQVVGQSMSPTLDGNASQFWKRDFVWLSRWSLYDCSPGAILTFISPRDQKSVHIKRITSTEGHFVKPERRMERMEVPKGHYWMEGDNPIARNDSNVYGPVATGLVQGRATHIIWPPSRWQRL